MGKAGWNYKTISAYGLEIRCFNLIFHNLIKLWFVCTFKWMAALKFLQPFSRRMSGKLVLNALFLHILGCLGSTETYLPCTNISLALDPATGFSGISRIECGARCLKEGLCDAFMFNASACLLEKSSLTEEVQVLAEHGCFATKGMTIRTAKEMPDCEFGPAQASLVLP